MKKSQRWKRPNRLSIQSCSDRGSVQSNTSQVLSSGNQCLLCVIACNRFSQRFIPEIADFLDTSCLPLKAELKFDFANFLFLSLIRIPWILYKKFFCCVYLYYSNILWIIPWFLLLIQDKFSGWLYIASIYLPLCQLLCVYCFPKRMRLGQCPGELCKSQCLSEATLILALSELGRDFLISSCSYLSSPQKPFLPIEHLSF